MEQIGRYQILEELGRGSSGVVYRALDPAIGRTIAIKSITLDEIEESEREGVRERILREARAAGTLSHPNIVTIYDVLDSDDSAHIFMEYVDGSSLEELFHQGNLPSRTDLLRVLRQVSEALDYAHRKGIVHRDVKPANIVIAVGRTSPDPVAKIADFGVAKVVSQEATHHGSVIGTPNYMSPEQVQGLPVSGASDQFSLAVLTYEFLTGYKPFVGEGLPALFYQICKQEEAPPHEVNAKLSPTVSKVMHRALSKKPEERFATCSGFIGALEFALGDCPDWAPLAAVDGQIPTRPKAANTGFIIDSMNTAALSGERAYPENRSWLNKLLLILALCGAVAITVMFIVRMNSGPNLPTQTLDAKNGPASPPPPDDLHADRRTQSPLDLTPVAGPVTGVANPGVTPGAKPAAKTSGVKSEREPVKAAQTAPVATAPKFENTTTTATIVKPSPLRPTRVATISGAVALLTDPPGATVLIDNTIPCTTPCSLTLSAGRHTLAANQNGFLTARKIFYVPDDKSLLIPMSRSLGVLMVSSEPPGSNVNVDGKPFGRTPITLRLPAGEHKLSVWDGSRWREETVVITAEEVHTRDFRF